MDLSTLIALVALIVTILGAVYTQGIWISRQFSTLKDFVNSKVDAVMEKLQYHERHDDQRFNDISNRIWGVRLDYAQARKDNGRYSSRQTDISGERPRGIYKASPPEETAGEYTP